MLLVSVGALVVLSMLTMRAEDAKALPQVTLEQQRDYHRSRANVAVAQQQLDTAQKALQTSVDEMSKLCGDRGLIANTKGDPECGVKSSGK